MIKGSEMINSTTFTKEIKGGGIHDFKEEISVTQLDGCFVISNSTISGDIGESHSVTLPEDMAISLFLALRNELTKNNVFEKYELIGDTLKKKENEKFSKIITG